MGGEGRWQVANVTSQKIGSPQPKCKGAFDPPAQGALILLGDDQPAQLSLSLSGKAAQHMRVEGHDRDRGVGPVGQIARHRRAQRRDAPPRRLDLHQHRHAPLAARQQRRQARDRAAVGQAHLVQRRGRQRRDTAGLAGHALKVGVMKDEGDAVAARPHVAFDAMAGGDGGVEGRHAIFTRARPVQPAMSKGPGGQDVRVRPGGQGRSRRFPPLRPAAAPGRPRRCAHACPRRRRHRPSVPMRHWRPWAGR